MSTLPDEGADFLYTSTILQPILEGIVEPFSKDRFIKAVEGMISSGKSELEIEAHYARVGAESVEGYRRITVDTLGDPRVHHSGAYEQRRRDNGGSQAGARQNTMSRQMAGLDSNAADSRRYIGQHYPPGGNSGSGYNYTSTNPGYSHGPPRNNTTSYGAYPAASGNRNRVHGDFPVGRDDRFTRGPDHAHPPRRPNDSNYGPASPYTGFEQYITGSRENPYSSNEQANSGSRRSRP